MSIGEVYSELELIQEKDNIGWRLLGRDPDNHGTIGQEAIDITYSDRVSIKNGAMGTSSIAMNKNTGAWGDFTLAAGFETIAEYDYQVVFGKFNQNLSTDVFEIGIGPDNDNRRNAFAVTSAGVILAPSLDIRNIIDDKSLITKEYFLHYVNQNGGQLSLVEENGKKGYRIAERLDNCDYENYTDIGQQAVDLSCSTMSGNSNGAGGDYSFAAGLNVIMRNEAGAVFGKFNSPKTGTLLEIGNGSGQAPNTHGNAFEVYNDGQIIAPYLTKDRIASSDDKSLVTKEYLQTSRIKYDIRDIDIYNPDNKVYGFVVQDYNLDSIEIFMNGLLLRDKRDYDLKEISNGIELSFIGKNYTLNIGDWLRVKIPVLIY